MSEIAGLEKKEEATCEVLPLGGGLQRCVQLVGFAYGLKFHEGRWSEGSHDGCELHYFTSAKAGNETTGFGFKCQMRSVYWWNDIGG